MDGGVRYREALYDPTGFEEIQRYFCGGYDFDLDIVDKLVQFHYSLLTYASFGVILAYDTQSRSSWENVARIHDALCARNYQTLPFLLLCLDPGLIYKGRTASQDRRLKGFQRNTDATSWSVQQRLEMVFTRHSSSSLSRRIPLSCVPMRLWTSTIGNSEKRSATESGRLFKASSNFLNSFNLIPHEKANSCAFEFRSALNMGTCLYHQSTGHSIPLRCPPEQLLSSTLSQLLDNGHLVLAVAVSGFRGD